MKITIVGAGAIGQLFAHYLVKKNQVQLWQKASITYEDKLHHPSASHDNYTLQNSAQEATRLTQNLNQFKSFSSQLTNLNGQVVFHKFSSNQANFLAQSDLILICVKSIQVQATWHSIKPYLIDDNKAFSQAKIMFIHNGIGALESIRDDLLLFETYIATTTHAALRLSKHHVKQTGKGELSFGEAFKNLSLSTAPQVQTCLEKALSPVFFHQDINPLLWKKLAINCAINPLTALFNCTNGELLTKSYQTHLKQAIVEIYQVTSKLNLVNQPWANDLTLLQSMIYQVCELTSANYSSMHQDIHFHRKTEIEFINGYLVKTAQALGIQLEYHQELIQKINQIQETN